MSNPYRDLGLPPCREPMFVEVALKRAKEKVLKTQVERTEWAIAEADMKRPEEEPKHLQSHARDLARKLDAVKAECDRWCNPTADAIRAILEGE